MRVGLLGTLELDGASGGIVLAAAKERSLLAALALRPNSVVSTDSLIWSLWGEDPPASARKTLQTYVSNLRQSLGIDLIETAPPGYALRVDPEDIDVVRFRRLVRRGEAAIASGDQRSASAVLREATALWRGEPFAGVAPHTGLAAEGVRLKEEYLSALESRITADLAAGRHAEIVGELEGLAHAHPFRERLWGYLMVALYRCGRQVDALATYQRVRERLLDELGLEPGGELRRVEAAILNHDPSMAAPKVEAGPITSAHPTGVVRSPVRYARSTDGVSIAYQVAGSGPVDILAVPGFVSHLDIWWNAPTDGLVRRLTSLGRLISFDKRGMGLSERPEAIEAMRWVDDALAVLDAVGAKDVVVLGISAGSPTAIRLAALHPDRVRALVMFGGGARTIAGPGYEIGHDRDLLESFAANLEKGWGTGVAISSYAPSRAKEAHVRDYWARYQQLSAAPTAAIRYFWATVETDVTDLLASVTVPTLVMHPERDLIAPVSWGRFVADRVPDAEFVALDSDVDLICVSDVIDDMAEEIGNFIERRVLSDASEEKDDLAVVTVLAVRCDERARGSVASLVESTFGRLAAHTVDGLTAVFETPGHALRCATELTGVDAFIETAGAGIHIGECSTSSGTPRGNAADVAACLAKQAGLGEVFVTRTVFEVSSSRTPDSNWTTRSVDLGDRPLEVVVVSPAGA